MFEGVCMLPCKGGRDETQRESKGEEYDMV